MIVPNQTIIVNWHPRNKSHLESKGYIYTHTGEPVEVKLEDMMEGSKCVVEVVCDYCDKHYKKKYKDCLKNRASNGKDCCKDCHAKKSSETNQIKYGGNSPFCSKEVIETTKENNLKKYGVEWISMLQTTKDKVAETNLKKYGVPCVSQCNQIKDKIEQTNIARYGGKSSQCSKEVREKVMKTRMGNGNVCSSSQERLMVKTLEEIYGKDSCFPQYPLSDISFDCLLTLNEVKIDVEYDGEYWHQDKHKDIRRDYFTIGQGYKVLRFRGNYEIPTKEQIIEGVSYLVNTEHHVKIIELDIKMKK